MNNKNLIEEIKKVLEYSEEAMSCSICKYSIETEDQAGLSYLYCNYCNLCSFQVKNYSWCSKFKNRNGSI